MQGLLLIDKPEGITSFSAVSAVKRAANEKRVGHTGTLDPMATGVLPILLGKATALSSIMLDADKRYIARVKLGIATDTCDITGKVLENKAVSCNNKQLLEAFKKFTGDIKQTPPIYSALKKDGVRLYDLARQGISVDIPSREITVFSLKLLEDLNEENEFAVECHVSKGTYIRSLARDIGEYLGCGATLTALRRTYASGFDINECTPLENIKENGAEGYILNEEIAVSHLRAITVTEKQAIRFCNGGQLDFERLKINNIEPNELFRIKYSDKLLGIGVADSDKNEIAIKCVINKI